MITKKKSLKRPKVILSAAISLDGQITTISGDSKLSNTEDWKRVHHLRASKDAIMVGSGTILADDSKLTVKPEYFKPGQTIRNPIRIVVSSSGKIPLDSRVIKFRPEIQTIIATTRNCPKERVHKFEKEGCEVIICGEEPLVNLRHLMPVLFQDYEIKSILLEGGSKLNGSMLTDKLIDEIHVAIAPVLGGDGVPFFTFPNEFSSFDQSPFLEILSFEPIGDMIYLHLRVRYEPRTLI